MKSLCDKTTILCLFVCYNNKSVNLDNYSGGRSTQIPILSCKNKLLTVYKVAITDGAVLTI